MNKKSDINVFVEEILNNRQYRNKVYGEYIESNYVFENIFGYIDSDVLKRMIKCSKRNYKLREMLTDILLYVNASSMTDENFQMLLRYPHKCRKTYLSSICHAELSFYQMKKLNTFPLALEAFTWLFDKICRYDCFTHEDMLCLLRENPDVKPIVISDSISLALEKYGNSSKIKVAQEWIGQS